MRALVLASMVVLAAACTKEGASPSDPSQNPEQAAAPAADQQLAGPQAVEAQINWEAARADFAKRPADQQNVTVQQAGQEGPSPVPMLLPGIDEPACGGSACGSTDAVGVPAGAGVAAGAAGASAGASSEALAAGAGSSLSLLTMPAPMATRIATAAPA